MAIASWVRPLAVPGPAPGPCDANAAPAQQKPATVEATTTAARKVRLLTAIHLMAISHDEHAVEDTTPVYAGVASEVKILGRKNLRSKKSCRNRLSRSAFMSVAQSFTPNSRHLLQIRSASRRGSLLQASG